MIVYDCCSAALGRAREAWLDRNSLQLVSVEGEQVSLELAHSHLRLDAYGSPPGHPDDTWLEQVGIPAAREYCEIELGRALAPSVYELTKNAFRGVIELPMSPVTAIVSIEYTDADGVDQAVPPEDYVLDASYEPAIVRLAPEASWPATASVPSAVRIVYSAGYTTPESSPNDLPMPKRYLAAMLLMLGHLYENREATTELNLREVPLAVESLLRPTSLVLNFA